MKRLIQAERRVSVAVLAFVAGLAAVPAVAGAELNPDADEILRSMSTFLAGNKAFSVKADISNEVITKDGEKLQMNSFATVLLERPSRFRATRHGRLADIEAYYDGARATIYGRGLNAYIQKEVTGNTDDLFAALEAGIGIDMPGTDLMVADPYSALSDGVTSSGYHGADYVGGLECHHLSFREGEVDWQIWIRTGDQPLPMKYVITTKWLTGAPQYSVQFSDWNLQPAITADRFRFVVPVGATKLDALPVDEAGELKVEKENN